MKFYSLINPESNKSLPIIRVSPTVIGDPGDEYAERDTDVVYRVSDHFETDQPLLLNNKESAIHLLGDPCLEIEDSHYENPCFDEVEEWVEFLVPVEIEITDTPLNKESMEISLYEIDESHNLFSKQSPCHSYKKDGNKFIHSALKKGASYVVSSKKNKKFKTQIINVDSPFTLVNKFANLKRKYCNTKIVAITGSAGKTSLKDMLNVLLREFGKTYASSKSFNNHFGVPVSLSNLSVNDKYGIFEVGMSKAGEIDYLSKMIKPNLAVITNIAEAHIENFKNIKGIAKAKSEIIDNIQDNGTVILNRDDKFFKYLSKKAKL